MSQYGNGFHRSLRAAASVSAYRVVAPDTATSNGQVRVIQIATETSFILGIAQQNAVAVDQAIDVVAIGYTKAAAGASVSAGALLTFVTSTGYVIELANGTFNTAGNSFFTSGSKVPKQIGVALNTGINTDAVLDIMLGISNFQIRVA